jgi:anhydro-N-acetylmuramic acid kinase
MRSIYWLNSRNRFHETPLMKRGQDRARSPARLVLGLMSGTSADGIDVALVRVPPGLEGSRRAHLENFATLEFPRDVRAAVLRLAEGAPVTTRGLSQLNVRLGQVFAQAALAACRRFRVSPRQVALIGSHGQTVYHQGIPSGFLGARASSTLQIGEPAVIAAETGITTVADFRPADMAAGGQGAPLVPWVDYLLYRDSRRGRAALNIGGIANLTVIPRAARAAQVFAFDTGPGNMVADALVRHFSRGRRHFDRDARMARRGLLLSSLLNRLLADPYFRLRPPKTAGREQYGAACVRRILDWGRGHRARPEDLVRTATLLTALSIVDAFHRWVLPRVRVQQVIVSGGGARNPLMMAQLAAALPRIELLTSDALGLPGDAKEAFAFALLANETIHRRPSNLPSATGADCPAILGKVCYAPPR